MTDNNFNNYSVGIATGDITPPVGTPLCGFGARNLHTSTAVYHPLRTVAVVIDDGRTSVLLVSAEWVFFEELTKRVRFRLSQATGIPSARIILSGTHTHCGPCVRTKDTENHGWIDHDYIQHAIETMAKTAARACKSKSTARLKFGIGRCTLAVNRRVPDPDNPGKVLRRMMPNPAGPTDHEVSILTVESLDGLARGILFHYSCHPTSRSGLQIGGDYVSFAYDFLQDLQGAFVYAQPCFLQGCGSDQKPRSPIPNSKNFDGRTIEQVREIGFELGQAVAQTIQSGELQPVTGPITMQQKVIDLKTEPLDRKLVAAELNNNEQPYKQKWARYHQERIDAGLPEERCVPFEIQTVRFGDSLAIVTLAAEATVEHALRLKRELRPSFKNVLPLAYTNDVVGYVPVKRQFPEFGYEVLDANQARKYTGRYVDETEDHIHETIRRMLDIR